MENLLKRLVSLVIQREGPHKPAGNPSSESVPLVEVNKGLRDMSVQLAEASARLREIERVSKVVRAHGGNAWSERQILLADYYSMLRGVLRVLDDCESLLSPSSPVTVVYEGLRRLLENQGVGQIDVKQGEPFDAEYHEVEPSATISERNRIHVVAEVIEKGYFRLQRDGIKVVIRPAKVRVTAEPPEARGEQR